MKKKVLVHIIDLGKKLILPALLIIATSGIYSFSVRRAGEDFLKQLGLTKGSADERIGGSFLGGSINFYGIKNLKTIAASNRSAVTKDLLAYAKTYVQSPAFKKEYDAMRDSYKPKETIVATPEQMKEERIAMAKKFVAETEETVKKSNADFKPIFEKVLVDAKKQLAEAENPKDKQYVRYQETYPQLVKDMASHHQSQLARWEERYPADPASLVKTRLEEFMRATADVDYDAAVVTKGGVRYFVKPEYERKDNRWKMAFRAGREVTETARAYVEQWISEIR